MKSTLLASLCALLLAGAPLTAAEEKSKPAGTVTSVSGNVTLMTKAADSGKGLKLGQPVFAGDRIKSGANGRAQIVLSDGTQLKINYLTDITLRDTDSKGKASARGIGSIKIALGNLWAKVTKKDSRLEFETPAAVAAVKGTEPLFQVDESGNLCLKLKEGKVELSGASGSSASLSESQQICVAAGKSFSQDQVKSWNGKGEEWLNEVNNLASDGVLKIETEKGTITMHYKKKGPAAK